MTTGIEASLLECQKEYPPIVFDAEAKGGRFSYKYASLGNILKTCVPVLNKHGILLTQTYGYPPGAENSDVHLITTLSKDGEERISALPFPFTEDMQELGKRTTYLKRYQLAALLSICAEADTDCNTSDVEIVATPKRQNTPKKAIKPSKEEMIAVREVEIKDAFIAETLGFIDRYVELDGNKKGFEKVKAIYEIDGKNCMEKSQIERDTFTSALAKDLEDKTKQKKAA